MSLRWNGSVLGKIATPTTQRGQGGLYSLRDIENFEKAGAWPYEPPLDTYGSAAAAYSLRLLRTAYTGSAIRVRRSNDNTERDIGFVRNVLNTDALLSFCGANNGFVVTWYDQSGNARDATQSTAASQPQIVSSGSVLTMKGVPRINCNAKTLSFTAYGSDNFSLFAVVRIMSVNNYSNYFQNVGAGVNGFRLLSYLPSDSYNLLFRYSGQTEQSANSRRATSSVFKSPHLQTWIYPNAAAVHYISNQTIAVDSTVASGWGNGAARLGSFDYTNANNGEVDLQEIIVYTSDQTNDRAGITDNINKFYALY